MSLPTATKIISSLPGGMRATVSRGSTVATYAVRAAVRDMGQFSNSGLDRDVQTNVWTLSADFSPKVKVGDVLTIDGTTAVVTDAMLSTGNLINRATCLMFDDTVSVAYQGQTVQGLPVAMADGESLTDYGERGISTSRVRVIASQLNARPAKGDTIVINSKVCIVGNVSTDPRGLLYTIDYQVTTPSTVQEAV